MALRCAVFASGGGSNFQALLDRRQTGELHVDFVLLVGNNSKAQAFERARKYQIPSVHLAPTHFPNQSLYTAKLLDYLQQYNVDLIVLAGYMKMLPAEVIKKYNCRIVNIHPGLLPAFGGKGMYGQRVHQAVLDRGVKVTGVTVHFVDDKYDNGPIILQETVPVFDTDDSESIAQRVLKVEHATYWRAVEAIAQQKLRIEGCRVLGDI